MRIIANNDRWYLVNDSKEEVILEPLDANKVYDVKSKTQTVRTYQANKALHVYFSLVSDALNDAGYSIQYVLNRKRNIIIKKVFGWLYSIFKAEVILTGRDRILFSDEVKIPWTMNNVKNLIWREFQIALTEKESTTKINSRDITLVYMVMDKHLSKHYGLESIKFPSREEMIFQQNYNN